MTTSNAQFVNEKQPTDDFDCKLHTLRDKISKERHTSDLLALIAALMILSSPEKPKTSWHSRYKLTQTTYYDIILGMREQNTSSWRDDGAMGSQPGNESSV